jgi:clathrin heavy chain
METVAESKDPALAEDLMRSIMEMEDKELVAAMLYTCYELIKPDVALEVAWRSDLMEFVMPYFIQFVKDLSTRVETVQKSTDDIKKKEEKQQQERLDQPLAMNVEMMFPGMGQPSMPAIMPDPSMMSGANPAMMNMNMQQNPMGMGMPNMQQNPFGNQF